MNHKLVTGTFVLQNKKTKKYFGVFGWNTVEEDDSKSASVVVFRRSIPQGRKTPRCQSDWHEDFWNTLIKKNSDWIAVPK